MVLTKEFRIPLPFTLEEYQKGQLYMIAKASREETNGSEGIEVLVNERFQSELGPGIYTHKVIHLSKRLPAWSRKLFGLDNVLQIEEKSWNVFPYCKTVYKSSLFGDKCVVVVESRHAADPGTQENIMNLSPEQLKRRPVELLDIAKDSNDHSNEELASPRSFVSKKRQRGPLGEDWIESSKPISCAYKYVHIDFQLRAFRSRIENMILDVMKSIYLRTHRQAYVWMDEWVDLSESDLAALEEEIHSHLNATMSNGQQNKLSGVPPMPSPPTFLTNAIPTNAASSSAGTSSNSLKPEDEPTKATTRESLSPPPRRLRSRLRDMASKLRAKL
jgi:hypothetical protein